MSAETEGIGNNAADLPVSGVVGNVIQITVGIRSFIIDGRVDFAVFDRKNGQSRGYGFVEMGSEDDAANAVNRLQGKPVDGCFIDVAISRPRATPITGWARDPGRQSALSRT